MSAPVFPSRARGSRPRGRLQQQRAPLLSGVKVDAPQHRRAILSTERANKIYQRPFFRAEPKGLLKRLRELGRKTTRIEIERKKVFDYGTHVKLGHFSKVRAGTSAIALQVALSMLVWTLLGSNLYEVVVSRCHFVKVWGW